MIVMNKNYMLKSMHDSLSHFCAEYNVPKF